MHVPRNVKQLTRRYHQVTEQREKTRDHKNKKRTQAARGDAWTMRGRSFPGHPTLGILPVRSTAT